MANDPTPERSEGSLSENKDKNGSFESSESTPASNPTQNKENVKSEGVDDQEGGSDQNDVEAAENVIVGEDDEEEETKPEGGEEEEEEESKPDPEISFEQVTEEVEQFISRISTIEDKSEPTEIRIPIEVEKFFNKVESMVDTYDFETKFGQTPEKDSLFLTAVNLLSRLMNALRGFPRESNIAPVLNQASSVLHRGMLFMEDELRFLVEESSSRNDKSSDKSKGLKSRQPSFKSNQDLTSDHHNSTGGQKSNESKEEETFPWYPPQVASAINLISQAMLSAGYEAECLHLFVVTRRHSLEEALSKQGFEKNSIDDVQKMQWETLEGEIVAWLRLLKHCSTHLFPGEQKLYESVFSNHHPSLSKQLFSDLTGAILVEMVNFAQAVAMAKRTTERVFKFLDMYEALRELGLTVDSSLYTEEWAGDLQSELSIVGGKVGEAAVCMFCELESSIKGDNAKTPVPSGAVHPLTRNTMNYLDYACEYDDTLEQVFRQHLRADSRRARRLSQDYSEGSSDGERSRPPPNNQNNGEQAKKQSPFTSQLMAVLDLLDANLDARSKLYKDPALRCIFLMNNGRFMLQRIRGSMKMHQVVGDSWVRRRSSEMRTYHKHYQRETWSKVLQCLNQEGLQVNGKVHKPVLKERFKNFNQLFDEIHKTQSTWVVSDEQLQSELQVSISAVMIPAYRSFLARFGQYFTPGRQTEKYIKYQPEDIESAIDGLFDGNPTFMARKKS